MTDRNKPNRPASQAAHKQKKREDALRANLLRRKQQDRARQTIAPGTQEEKK